MSTKLSLLAAAGLSTLTLSASAQFYSGNGNSGFGGPVGQGSLTLSDNGTTISGTWTRGPGNANDVLVIYLDSVAGGFTDTLGFADGNDGLRRAISGFDGGANRSLMTFASGFNPDYAIALGPSSDSFGGLWVLANGGGGSHTFVDSVNLNPTGTASSPTYTFSLNFSEIGLGSPANFNLYGTYIANSGYRSDESIAGNATGVQGWNPFTQTAFGTYVVPEPSSAVLMGLGGLGLLLAARRRRK